MLSLLKIKNVALIDTLTVEFGGGLNLLTGETGSGKSIIVDSLAALIGERVSSDLIKEGESSAQIEGLFTVSPNSALAAAFEESGIEIEPDGEAEIIIRREISLAGKNRIFINDQMATQTLLRRIGQHLVDIHGQGEQAALYDVATHGGLLDEFAGNADLRARTAAAYAEWSEIRRQLASLEKDDSEKLQLLDILRFQVAELKAAGLRVGEDAELEEEKRQLNNVEKLTSLSSDAYALLYDNAEATLATLERAARKIDELGEFESKFLEFGEGIRTAQAVLEEAAFAARDFRHRLEFSPERLDEIETRLAEISRLKRKYGDSIESLLEHLAVSETRLAGIETADLTAAELRKTLAEKRAAYITAAAKLHDSRVAAARRFEKNVGESFPRCRPRKGEIGGPHRRSGRRRS